MTQEPNKFANENNDQFGLPTPEFKPVESPGNKRWVKITILIAGITVLVGAGVITWLFYPSEATYHLFKKAKSNELEENEETAIANEQNAQEGTTTLSPSPIPTAHTTNSASSTNPIPVVDTPTGMYYVIVCSYIDIDLANDHGKKLRDEGNRAVKLILPPKGQHFIRLAVAETASKDEADAVAKALKPTHGKNVWVLKY
jgi:hypothetical protein